MARNTRSSQKYRGHDENSMGGGGSLSAKSKWDWNPLIVPLWQEVRYMSPLISCYHYDYWAAESA